MAAKTNMNFEAPFVGAVGNFAEYLVHIAGTVIGSVSEAASRVLAGLQIWQSRIDQRRHLNELDSRLLNDMGFTLEQAQLETNKPFWKA